jgi:hypothetical protein
MCRPTSASVPRYLIALAVDYEYLFCYNCSMELELAADRREDPLHCHLWQAASLTPGPHRRGRTSVGRLGAGNERHQGRGRDCLWRCTGDDALQGSGGRADRHGHRRGEEQQPSLCGDAEAVSRRSQGRPSRRVRQDAGRFDAVGARVPAGADRVRRLPSSPPTITPCPTWFRSGVGENELWARN